MSSNSLLKRHHRKLENQKQVRDSQGNKTTKWSTDHLSFLVNRTHDLPGMWWACPAAGWCRAARSSTTRWCGNPLGCSWGIFGPWVGWHRDPPPGRSWSSKSSPGEQGRCNHPSWGRKESDPWSSAVNQKAQEILHKLKKSAMTCKSMEACYGELCKIMKACYELHGNLDYRIHRDHTDLASVNFFFVSANFRANLTRTEDLIIWTCWGYIISITTAILMRPSIAFKTYSCAVVSFKYSYTWTKIQLLLSFT